MKLAKLVQSGHIQWCAPIIRHCMSIVPSSALQVDIYVTNFKPVPLRHPVPLTPLRGRFDREPTRADEELQPPHPKFVREDTTHLRSRSTDSVDSHESHESDVDLSYYLGDSESPEDEPAADEMGVAHEANILDLTNFDGDIDMALPGEGFLSHRLKKEGKLRRLSRKLSTMGGTKQDARPPRTFGSARTARHDHDPRQSYADKYTTSQPSRVPQPRRILTLSTQSTDRLLPISPLSERLHSASSETDMYSPLSHRSESLLLSHSPLNAVPLTSDLPTVSLVTAHGGSRPPVYPVQGNLDVKSEPGTSQVPLSATNGHLDASHPAGLSMLTQGFHLPFEMGDQEAIDINVVSEHARPGKPKLDKVIADEVQASKGAIVVACQLTPYCYLFCFKLMTCVC